MAAQYDARKGRRVRTPVPTPLASSGRRTRCEWPELAWSELPPRPHSCHSSRLQLAFGVDEITGQWQLYNLLENRRQTQAVSCRCDDVNRHGRILHTRCVVM